MRHLEHTGPDPHVVAPREAVPASRAQDRDAHPSHDEATNGFPPARATVEMMNAVLKREIERQAAGAPVPTVATRDHEVIRAWATRCGAEPATGEATASGPATVHVNHGGAGIRFNFPGAARFRPIPWAEWFDNFERHWCRTPESHCGSTASLRLPLFLRSRPASTVD
jgi:hypothetical protein